MVHTTAPQTSQTSPQVQPTIETNFQAALEHARRLTEMYGAGSVEVAIAWETVEELAKAKREQQPAPVSSLTAYCELYPEAPECRIYED